MRHRKSFNHLSRKSPHRKAMLSNMATSLILHKRINTTLAKAKALRSYVEPIITKAKEDSTHSRRVVFSYLQDKQAVTELFREISVKVGDRPGGYTRIIKLGNRLGDNADMAMIELVDYNENLLQEKAEKKAKAGRRRRGGKKKVVETTAKKESQAAAKPVEVDKEEPKAEVKEEPKTEVKEEPKAEVKEEPKAEVKEEPKAEAKEEPKAEVKEEPKAEVKEEPKAEAKKEEKEEKTGEDKDKKEG